MIYVDTGIGRRSIHNTLKIRRGNKRGSKSIGKIVLRLTQCVLHNSCIFVAKTLKIVVAGS